MNTHLHGNPLVASGNCCIIVDNIGFGKRRSLSDPPKYKTVILNHVCQFGFKKAPEAAIKTNKEQ